MSVPRQQLVEPAASDDVGALHGLRRQLEDWLHAKGVRQWPRGEVDRDDIARQVDRGEWHLVRSTSGGVAAAMRVLWSDPDFWGSDVAPAVYVHGLMVDRDSAGLGWGPFMLDHAARIGRAAGVRTLRLDCAEHNEVLRAFYRRERFREVGRRDFDGLFGVTLFERDIPAVPPGERDQHLQC